MAEYIEREALLEKAWDADTRAGYVQVVDVGDILDATPADVVAVVHGDWEKQSGIYSCSVCGKACPYHEEDGAIWYWHCEFCPHCGAKMDGERREEDGA